MINQETLPEGILNLADYERLARDKLPHPIFEHIAGGCGKECTQQGNSSAFDELGLYTRVLRDFSRATTAVTLLDQTLLHPILLAPVAHQTLVHPQGEHATAMAARASDTPMVVSTLSSHPLEQINSSPPGANWFQLYWQPSRKVTLDLVRRAEEAGYRALVITVDTPITALRYRGQRAGFALPEEVTEANLEIYPKPERKPLDPGQSPIFGSFMADAPRWEDIDWLREKSKLPILLKGISHPGDAMLAKERGLDGVIVSNHGGRSLDGIPATIKLLPAIRRVTGDTFPVLLDGGIRSGGDIFKALALGADAVLVGRPQLYALAVAGALGVAHMLKLLKEELEVTMALAGCPTLAHIKQDCIY